MTVMPGLSETLKELTSRLEAGLKPVPTRLTEASFAPNPGHLRMWQYRPANLPPGAPLVVVLHGCTQTAASYDAGSGWSALADRHGFALLFPEQVHANNAQNCFNWFEPGDAARGKGEAASVAAMVTQMLGTGGLDRSRVFVTGLSAGGAMTAVMLSCYPEMFAAGAVVAGLPFGVATDVRSALDAMFRGSVEPGPALGGRVRAAAPGFRGSWPRVTVWHGAADHTVKPINAAESVKQWLDVHGITGAGRTEDMGGATRTVWQDRAGRAAVEQVSVPGLGHGVPVAPGQSGIGTPGPYFLPAAVSCTEEVARFFGLLPASVRTTASGPTPASPAASGPAVTRLLSRVLRDKLDPWRFLGGR